ncbi:MAG: hypothetical protein ABIR32_03795, partial [Ilumatobacteraceae bacterium]
AFRYRIRRLGPIVGLVPPALLGAIAAVALHDNTSSIRGVGGFAAAVFAAPGMLAFGVPLASGTSKVVLGAMVSAAVWFVLGLVAARRATRSPVATWRDFWREFIWLAGGVWLGTVIALVVVQIAVGSAIL